jgi:putative YhdH/YhfP family quinone oxidoreductase
MIVEKSAEAGAERRVTRRIAERSLDDLPDGEVLVEVVYSSLNYKDALSATGHPGVTKHFPHTPGIDAAGTVVESSRDDLPVGTEVIAFGYDLGMNTPGGFGRYIRVPGDWLLSVPGGMTLHDAMVYGTAGFTAAYSVEKLRAAGLEDDGDVLVTGASGGVGSVAVALLSRLGYRVSAMTGKREAHGLLQQLGAAHIIPRTREEEVSKRPLESGRWSGVLDTVGGAPLSQALKEIRYDGVACCCGLAASPDLATTVYPFILRDVSLIGVDSVNCNGTERRRTWNLLAGEWGLPRDQLRLLSQDVELNDLDAEIDKILSGGHIGRSVVVLPGE